MRPGRIQRRQIGGHGLGGWGALPFLFLWTSVAGAAGASAVPTRLDFVSRDGCGTPEDIVRRVTVRSPRIRLTPAAPSAHMVRVEIESAPDGSRGATLTFFQTAGRRTSRHVRTGTCDEALDAIALILAVTLDPSVASATPSAPPVAPPAGGSVARRTPPVGSTPHARPVKSAPTEPAIPPAEPANPRRQPAPISGDPVPPSVAPVDRPEPPAVPPVPVPPRPEIPASKGEGERPPAAASSSSATFFTSGGLAAQTIAAPAPRVMPGLGLYAIVGWDRASPWSPILRITGTRSWTRAIVASAGTAHFQLDLISLDLCPVWLRRRGLGLGGCLTGAGGRLAARGSQTFAPQAHNRPFATGGASLIATFELGRVIEISASVTGAATLVRDRFAFSPEVFHEVPAVALTAGVGVGLRFW